jgi:hypothetical protein
MKFLLLRNGSSSTSKLLYVDIRCYFRQQQIKFLKLLEIQKISPRPKHPEVLRTLKLEIESELGN